MKFLTAILLLTQFALFGAESAFSDERGSALAKALEGQFYLVKDFRVSEGAPPKPATAEVIRSLVDCGIAIPPPVYSPVSAPGCIQFNGVFIGSFNPYDDGHYHFRQVKFLNHGLSAVGIDLVVSRRSTPDQIQFVEIQVGELKLKWEHFTFEGFQAEVVIPGRKVVLPDKQIELAFDRIERVENPRSALIGVHTITLRDTGRRYRDILRSWAIARASTYAGLDRNYKHAFLEWVEGLALPTQDIKTICMAFLPGNSQARADLERPGLTAQQMLIHVVSTLGIAPGGNVDSSSAVFLKEQLQAMSTTDKLKLIFERDLRAELRHVFLDSGGFRQLIESVGPDHVGLLVEQFRNYGHYEAMSLLEAVFSRSFESTALAPLIGIVCNTEKPEIFSRIWKLLQLRGGNSFFSTYHVEISAALRGCGEGDIARAEGLEQLRQVSEPWVYDLYLEFVVQDPFNHFDRFFPRHPLTESQVTSTITKLLNHPQVYLRSTGLAILDSSLVPDQLFDRVTETIKARARVESDFIFRKRLLEVIGRRVT